MYWLALLCLLDLFLDQMEFFLNFLMILSVSSQDLIHFLTIGMLLGWLDGLGVFGLYGLDAIVVVFECCDHLPNGLDVLYKLIVNAFILLLTGVLFVGVAVVEFVVGHGLVGDVEVLDWLIEIPFWVRVACRSLFKKWVF